MAARAASIASGSLSGSRPAGLRHRVAPAASAAGDLGGDLDHLAGLHAALDERGRDRGHEVHAAVDRGAEHDRGGVAELALDAIGDVHERLGVGRVDDLGQHDGAVDLRGARGEGGRVRPLADGARLGRGARLGAQGGDRLGQALGLRAQRVGRLVQEVVVAAQETDRLGPGDRLDAAHVGRARALADDLEQPDLGRGAHVGAAAQLARVAAVADLDHPHDVAVLLAEEGHRPQALGLVERRRQRAHRVVAQDPRR